MAKKRKFERVEMVLHGVLSYPDLHNPKPFKGKIYRRTDVLFEQDDPQLAVLKKKLNQLRIKTWGEDKSEWPEGARKRFIQDGNEREDQPTYEGKFFITASTQSEVPVIDTKGKTFSPAMVKGGMFAKVAVCLSPWENEGDEGMSIYLQGVMVDLTKEKLPGFGGGKSVKQLFGLEDDDSDGDDSDDDDTSDDAEDDEEDMPRGKKSKKRPVDEEDDNDSDSDLDDEPPVKKKKAKKSFVDDDEE